MSTLDRAIVIATTAHAGQRDKAGAPYILHPLRVMLRTSSESERIAAVLHDVVEDTPITIDALREFGFSPNVLRAVALLTKINGENYSDFIARAATDDIARRVKLADIADNMDLGRIPVPTERDHARIEQYRAARKYLEAVERTRGVQRGVQGPTWVQMAPTIVPLQNEVTTEMVEAACPVANARIYACDFYVAGIERHKDSFPGGYRSGRIYNVDHHAPVDEMARRVTSTMLALEAIGAGAVAGEVAYTVINHTDCDSMLSSALVMGLIPATSPTHPDVHAALSAASVNADHTGADDQIADLLQGLDEQRHGNRTDDEYLESLRNLLLLLDGKPLELAGECALKDRHRARARAAALIRSGEVQTGRVAYGKLTEEIDGAFFVQPLPDAWVIMLVSPHPEYPDRWAVKLRLGNSAPAGFTLQLLGITDFDRAYGGRWNAGSNKRGGGTTIAPEEYRVALTKRVNELAAV